MSSRGCLGPSLDNLDINIAEILLNGRVPASPRYKTNKSAEGQTRTVDTGIFSAVLYHLSYLGWDFYYRIRRGGCQGGNPRLNAPLRVRQRRGDAL